MDDALSESGRREVRTRSSRVGKAAAGAARGYGARPLRSRPRPELARPAQARSAALQREGRRGTAVRTRRPGRPHPCAAAARKPARPRSPASALEPAPRPPFSPSLSVSHTLTLDCLSGPASQHLCPGSASAFSTCLLEERITSAALAVPQPHACDHHGGDQQRM